MKFLKTVIAIFILFVASAVSSMDFEGTDSIVAETIETIKRCHVKGALHHARTNLDQILSPQPYNICAIIIVPPSDRPFHITLDNIRSIPSILPACLHKDETLSKSNIAVFKNHDIENSLFKKAESTPLKISRNLQEMLQQNLTEASIVLPSKQDYRWTDAEEIAFYALQLLIVKSPQLIPQGSKIILVTLMNTCHYCAHSAVGFLKRHRPIFVGMEVHYIVPHSGKAELTKSLSELDVTHQQIYVDRKEFANLATERSLELLLHHDASVMRNAIELIMNLCRSIPDIQMPPSLAFQLAQNWFNEARELLQVQQFINALKPSFSKEVVVLHPTFAIDFVANCFDCSTILLEMPFFVDSLCQALPKEIDPSLKMSPPAAVWFMQTAFELFPAAITKLLEHPLYVSLLYQAWPTEALSIVMHPLLTNWFMTQGFINPIHVEFLRRQPFVISLCLEFSKNESIEPRITQNFALSFFEKGFNDNSLQLLHVPQFRKSLCFALESDKAVSNIKMHGDFIAKFATSCQKNVVVDMLKVRLFAQSFYSESFKKISKQQITLSSDFVSAVMETCFEIQEIAQLLQSKSNFTDFLISLMKSVPKSTQFRIHPELAKWFIMRSINTHNLLELLKFQYFVHSFDEIEEFDIPNEFYQNFVEQDIFETGVVNLFALRPFVNLLCRFISTFHYTQLTAFSNLAIAKGLPISAAPLFEAQSFVESLLQLFDTPTSIHPDFAICYASSEFGEALLEKPNFATSFCKSLSESLKHLDIEVSRKIIIWSIGVGFEYARTLCEENAFIAKIDRIISNVHIDFPQISPSFMSWLISSTNNNTLSLLQHVKFINAMENAINRKAITLPKKCETFIVRLKQIAGSKHASQELKTAANVLISLMQPKKPK